MSIVKLTSVAVLALPVVLSACGSSESRPLASSTYSSSAMSSQQSAAPSTDYEASQRIYNRSLRK
jgi:hypothetical protein